MNKKSRNNKKNLMPMAIALAVVGLFVASSTVSAVSPLENRESALDGADRLVEVQFGSGAFPWVVGDSGEPMNVQGVTALGLLDAYTVSLDASYLEAAEANRDWHEEWMNDNEGGFVSAPSAYFLAKYALLTTEFEDLELAREALQNAIDFFGSPAGLAEWILDVRAGSPHTNLGLWDVALFVRAAHDVGNTTASAELAEALVAQTTEDGIVDAWDADAGRYELGLTGLLFGLSEADFLGHQEILAEAETRLLDTQCEDGSFTDTYQGETECGAVQATAFSVIGLTHAFGDVPAAQSGCDFIRDAQNENGGWGSTEIAEVNSEAVQALVSCVAPVHNGATSYADAAVDLLPL